MYYFDSSKKYAEDLASTIKVLGFFNVGIFDNGKLKEMRTLNLPTMIVINVYDSEVREVELSNKQIVQCKVVAVYTPGQVNILGVHEVPFVEQSGFQQCFGSQQHKAS